MKLMFFIIAMTACQTKASNTDAKNYFWNLIIDGESHPNIKSGQELPVAPYSCTMDKNIKAIKNTGEMSSRWLQCDHGNDFFRLMTECKSQKENSSYVIIGKNNSRKRILIELSCIDSREL